MVGATRAHLYASKEQEQGKVKGRGRGNRDPPLIQTTLRPSHTIKPHAQSKFKNDQSTSLHRRLTARSLPFHPQPTPLQPIPSSHNTVNDPNHPVTRSPLVYSDTHSGATIPTAKSVNTLGRIELRLVETKDNTFSMHPSCELSKRINASFHKRLIDFWPTFRKIPLNDKDLFFEDFLGQVYGYDAYPIETIRKHWKTKARKKYSDMVNDTKEKNAKPVFMTQAIWEKWLQYWDLPKVKEISKKASTRRNSKPTLNSCGSSSTLEHAESLLPSSSRRSKRLCVGNEVDVHELQKTVEDMRSELENERAERLRIEAERESERAKSKKLEEERARLAQQQKADKENFHAQMAKVIAMCQRRDSSTPPAWIDTEAAKFHDNLMRTCAKDLATLRETTGDETMELPPEMVDTIFESLVVPNAKKHLYPVGKLELPSSSQRSKRLCVCNEVDVHELQKTVEDMRSELENERAEWLRIEAERECERVKCQRLEEERARLAQQQKADKENLYAQMAKVIAMLQRRDRSDYEDSSPSSSS